jgi:Tfp pilus assembly PilM family ATPase
MFSTLTEPNYPKAAIGLERDAVTALALQKEGRGRYGVSQAATIDLPTNLLTPSFIERNIASPQELRVLLEEVVVSAGLMSQKNWSVSLPSNTARTAILTLENGSAAKGETEEILDWKAEQSFGAPSGELRVTRHKISDDREGRSRYFATAVKLSVIDEYETIFESLGWTAGLILPRALSETKWLLGGDQGADSLLLSSQNDGFTAVLLRGDEPAVVRSVTCSKQELDDEIYRLLMFYHDRFASAQSTGLLENLLVVGKDLAPNRIRDISTEALGRTLRVLRAEDVGLNLPVGSLTFDDLAAPAGLASYGCR